jgi:oligopeptide/dipeptide ABC transporter ATP-binding protein
MSSRSDADEPLLRVRGLAKHYPVRHGILRSRQAGVVRAVDGVSFDLRAGETLGLVGESGCGKSTLARTVLRLEVATAGEVLYRGSDMLALEGPALRSLRRKVQVIFQDPYASLNPRMTVAQILSEPWAIHPHLLAPAARAGRIAELLERVGLHAEHARRYPHQFSGGQRQRIGIARALALEPEVVICDEPVSALDVSVQAQVINLLEDLRDQMGLSYLFIAHDLSIVRHLCDRVAVMYLGGIVEQGLTERIFGEPRHPYTRALLSASPVPDPDAQGARERIRLRGEVPNPADRPSGCRFRTRCWKAAERCSVEEPALSEDGRGHGVACHFPQA